MEARGARDTADVLKDVAQRLGASLDLPRTLDEVVRSVVDRLGFGLAVLNLVTDDDAIEVVAFAGPPEVGDQLLGRRQSGAAWQHLLASSEPLGRLRFLDGRKGDEDLDEMYFWVPEMPVDERPDSWHPLDALFATLFGADGSLLGVLSVDLPQDGMRPDPDDCALLEVFAVQAALAIDHARLYSELQGSLQEQQRVQDVLRHQALHDPLTGLANRELLRDRLDHALARSRRDGSSVAVLFLDVDDFKLVNDSFGHGVGDELLVCLAALLGAHLREVDTAGRLGGDEFVLILEELTGPAEAIAVAERVLLAAREPIRIGGELVRTSMSIGISLAAATSTASGLLAEADTALYRAKAAGRARWEIFDADMRAEALAQLALGQQLSGAVARQEFLLHYQPLVDLSSGRTLGYEALLRWQHPERGLLLPATFLPVLEDSDVDTPVAEWVLERACLDAAAWPDPDLFISVNVSPQQLARPDLARRVAAVLERTGLSPHRLWVEITEDRPLDPRQDIEDVQRLRDLGVHVALDDFGTGYAGLAYLQQLPADTLKIDQIFVSRLEDDRISMGIVRAVVDLAEVLGLRIVAEGVQTQGQVDALRALGVTWAQGYLLGPPGPLPTAAKISTVVHARLADDLPSELRRLHAALSASSDARQVAELTVQAALRSVGGDGGAFAVPGPAGSVAVLHAQGYSASYIEQYRTFALDRADLLLAVCMRERREVWLEAEQLAQHLPPSARSGGGDVVALACLPVGSTAAGGLMVTWSAGVQLAPLLRSHLQALVALVGERLEALPPWFGS